MASNTVTFAFTANSQSSGNLAPRPGIGINVSLAGTFVATVGLFRSFDQGTTWRLVASYTGQTETSVIEWENGTLYQFQTTAYTSGTANARLSQTI